ncbi:MAG: mechanosensitive ion channel [Bacteroidaceae bacterium]|nr:mechanosensitive ion channel [Bacteroidaceae bacterium]
MIFNDIISNADIIQAWNETIELRLTTFVATCILLLYLTDLICRKAIVPLANKITRRTSSKWDDILLNSDVLTNIFRIFPPIIMLALLPHMFGQDSTIYFWSAKVIEIYITAISIKLSFAILNALYDISNQNQRLKNRTLKGVFQMFKIIAICVGAIIIISIVIDKNPSNVLTGLGAMAAVLMLVFKDPIMGLVAGVQLSANDMLRPGDWITLPKHDADGEVVEVTLTTVKVQNWDKTITTIPPYALVSESFQNWRGMFDSGGRRIKRSIYIDMNSISFCTPEQQKRFGDRGWLKGLEEHDESIVNLTVLRNYLDIYLRSNKRVNQDMTLMIRQLQPTAQGLPLELYFFSANTAWVAYEHLQADIFEHIIAMLPEFGLKVFQNPAGRDLNGLIARE